MNQATNLIKSWCHRQPRLISYGKYSNQHSRAHPYVPNSVSQTVPSGVVAFHLHFLWLEVLLQRQCTVHGSASVRASALALPDVAHPLSRVLTTTQFPTTSNYHVELNVIPIVLPHALPSAAIPEVKDDRSYRFLK